MNLGRSRVQVHRMPQPIRARSPSRSVSVYSRRPPRAKERESSKKRKGNRGIRKLDSPRNCSPKNNLSSSARNPTIVQSERFGLQDFASPDEFDLALLIR